MKEKLSKMRSFFINFLLILAAVVVVVSVWISPTWVMSSHTTNAAWVLVVVALGATTKLDKVILPPLRFFWRREVIRWENHQRYRAMAIANPNWNWRQKGEIKFPKVRR